MNIEKTHAEVILPPIPQKTPHKRSLRNFLLLPKFQLGFVAFSLAACVFVLGVLAYNHTRLMHRFIAQGEFAKLPLQHPYFVYMKDLDSELTKIFWMTSCLVFLLFGLGAIVFSHRIAGPLYKLKKHMAETSRLGHPPYPLSFRQGDFFRELVKPYNDLLKRLGEPKK